MGKSLFNGDLGGMKSELDSGWARYKKNYDQGQYDILDIPGAIKRRGLDNLEKLLAERSKHVMEEYKAKPKIELILSICII